MEDVLPGGDRVGVSIDVHNEAGGGGGGAWEEGYGLYRSEASGLPGNVACGYRYQEGVINDDVCSEDVLVELIMYVDVVGSFV